MKTGFESAEQMLTAYEERCANTDDGAVFRGVLEHIGDKWALLIVGTLAHGPLRFGAMLEHIPGISQRMLTRTLRRLERDGVVSRRSYPEVPPRVDYSLTPLGHLLIAPAAALSGWIIDHLDDIRSAQAAYDAAPPVRRTGGAAS